MACSNCFNGCADGPLSDQCVKYTGIPISALGIATGDTLLHVENQIISKVQELMDGSGIIPEIDPNDVCEVVQELMPCCPPHDLNTILTVFLKSICILNDKNEALKDRIIIVETAINALNADYILPASTPPCLTGVTATSDTHAVLQAVINKLCTLSLTVTTEYVRLDQVEGIVNDVIEALPVTTLINAKMVPFSILPFYGETTGIFDGTGAGMDASLAGKGNWTRIFLCNGENGTPDLRGRTLVGTTKAGNVPMDYEVDPNSTVPVGAQKNPEYFINTRIGSNRAGLELINMPSHNHNDPATNSAIIKITDPGHIHPLGQEVMIVVPSSFHLQQGGDFSFNAIRETLSGQTGLKGTGTGQNVYAETVNAGGGIPHANNQPAHGMNFIIYIP